MDEIFKAFNEQPVRWLKDRNYVITPLLDHEPETTYVLMKDVVESLSKLTDFSKADKVVGEEDRGGYIAALLAYANKKSLAMVKWFPVDLEKNIKIKFRNSYTKGEMYLYGVKKHDRVILVEDMVDSGGTIISMIKLLRKVGAKIMDVIVIAEKEEFKGINRIKDETGIDVKFLLKFSSSGNSSKVTWMKNDKK
ncbi:hypothetical protein A2740_02435 [Candidatus Nomurabacteria bacterium RIFCSPHIGHO2_01_FULL_43_16]|nr:MAG: hypothetical protein A2740_02435 [Candidatus Nomurabacteria bacterium RIFCSPHIGHO2_01_FULL_43_16]OGI97543.1 MAG: hypothetical protein A3A11_03085 [Candidatus Nomurabacteria bacterium RIFCSPLOWO2_01_FULL_43_15]